MVLPHEPVRIKPVIKDLATLDMLAHSPESFVSLWNSRHIFFYAAKVLYRSRRGRDLVLNTEFK